MNSIDFFISESDSDDESEDDEDDEEELERELEKIKAERAAAAAKREQDERMIAEKMSRDKAMNANPIIAIEENSAKVSSGIPLPPCCMHRFMCALCRL